MIRTVCFLFLLLFVQQIIISQEKQEVWTLGDCMNYALENNLSIKRQHLNTYLFEKEYNQSYFNLLPNLSANAEHQISEGRSLNLELYEWERVNKQQGYAYVQSNLTLFNGLSNLNKIKRERYSFLSSQEDLEKAKNDIILSITTAYLQILFDEELLEVAKSQYEITRLQVEKTKRLVEVGNVARGELLEIQAQAANEKLNLANARNNLRLSVLDLTQLLDLKSAENFEIFKPEIDIDELGAPSNASDVYNTSIEIMPEINSAKYSLMSSEKDLAVQKAQRYPELYLNGLFYSRYLKDGNISPDTYPYLDQLKDNRYSQLTIGLSIPIFNRFQTQTKISKAKIMVEDHRYKLEMQKQQLFKIIQQAEADAIASLEKYISAREAVISNKEAFNYTRQKFEVGLVNSVDFNISRNNLTKASSDLVQAKYEYIFKMKILDFYQGNRIQL